MVIHSDYTSVFDTDEGFRQQLSHWRHVIDLTTPRRANVVHRGASCAPYCSPEGLCHRSPSGKDRRIWWPRLFHSLLAQHWRQAICLPPRLCKETVSGFEKKRRREFSSITWDHDALQLNQNALYVIYSQSIFILTIRTRVETSQTPAMSQLPLTILQPPGWSCVTV